MRTLGIIGGGIVGKSLLFSLAQENRQKYDRVILFESEEFAPACTFRSTAIVAARGVLTGVTPLGDNIHQGIIDFKEHVRLDSPHGVYPIYQISSAQRRMAYFHRRYKKFEIKNHFRDLAFKKELPLFTEEAYYVNPPEYCQWLFDEAKKKLSIDHHQEFVTSIDDELNIKTLNGNTYKLDHLILAGGVKNPLWSSMVEDRRVSEVKFVKGSFLLFKDIDWGEESYSLSMDDLNIIYRAQSRELIVGSTADESQIYSPFEKETLMEAYQYFSDILVRPLPDFKEGIVLTGVREKSIKREPYVGQKNNISYIGGLYKNGYTLSLRMARSLVNQLP